MKRKPISIIVIVLILIVGLVHQGSVTFATDITDIDGHWGKSFIEELVGMSIVSGYPDGTFKPNATITRAEFTVMLLKARGIEPLDATDSHWASGWRAAAVGSGLLKSGEFDNIDKNITRGEIALMITRSIGESPFMKARTSDITDADALGMELQNAIYSVFDYGIVSGYSDSTFKYDQPATRAEAATMTIRTIQSEKRSDNPRVFTKETLAYFNGQNDMKTLVAVDGLVYDLSGLAHWSGGTHYRGITAGMDLTDEIMNESPHGMSVLSNVEVVGTYIK